MRMERRGAVSQNKIFSNLNNMKNSRHKILTCALIKIKKI